MVPGNKSVEITEIQGGNSKLMELNFTNGNIPLAYILKEKKKLISSKRDTPIYRDNGYAVRNINLKYQIRYRLS